MEKLSDKIKAAEQTLYEAGISKEEVCEPFDTYRWILPEIEKLESELESLRNLKKEMIKEYDELLDEAEYLYGYYPNSFRETASKYYKHENDFLKKLQDDQT